MLRINYDKANSPRCGGTRERIVRSAYVRVHANASFPQVASSHDGSSSSDRRSGASSSCRRAVRAVVSLSAVDRTECLRRSSAERHLQSAATSIAIDTLRRLERDRLRVDCRPAAPFERGSAGVLAPLCKFRDNSGHFSSPLVASSSRLGERVLHLFLAFRLSLRLRFILPA